MLGKRGAVNHQILLVFFLLAGAIVLDSIGQEDITGQLTSSNQRTSQRSSIGTFQTGAGSCNYNSCCQPLQGEDLSCTDCLSGIAGRWNFDEGSGTIVNDCSGNNNHGTLTGATWTLGIRGNALSFDDDLDEAVVPTTLWSASSGSSAFAIKPASPTGVHYLFGHDGPQSGYDNRIQLYFDGANTLLDLGLGDSHTTAVNIYPFSQNQWYDVVLTWDNGNYKVYVNGQEVKSGAYSGLSALNTFADIGNNGGSLNQGWRGVIDEARVYSRALSSFEAETYHNELNVPDCADGLDNDDDGASDNADFSCQQGNNQENDALAECQDTFDNDDDTFIDYPDDSSCSNFNDNDEGNVVVACSDSADNDADGWIDFPRDPGCISSSDTDEANGDLGNCADNVEDDEFTADGMKDGDDPFCTSSNSPTEEALCQNGRDDDGDGFCDLSTGACADGSTPGDPGCSELNDNDESNGGGNNLAFTTIIIDPNNPSNPYVKTVGDFSGDGYPDAVAGSGNGDDMFWYRYPAWAKSLVATGSFSTDMQSADVDLDGDIDIIAPKTASSTVGARLYWYDNPTWAQNFIAELSAAGSDTDIHDVEIGDVNGDSKLDVVGRRKGGGGTYFVKQNSPTSWTAITADTSNKEGTAVGDIDLDGDLDIANNGFWLERISDTSWGKHTIDTAWSSLDVGVHIRDINQDGKMDVLIAPSESANGALKWYEYATIPTGVWTAHTIDTGVSYVHTFKTGDMDFDGDLDVVIAEMHQSPTDRVRIYLNNGNALSWTPFDVVTTGSHNIRLADFGCDRDLDIYGSNWNNNAADTADIKLWRNDFYSEGTITLNSWARHVVDPNQADKAIFVAGGDLNGDDLSDIIAGDRWYRNPGTAGGTWTINTIGSPLNNMAAVYDFDRDGDLDILGTQGVGQQSNDFFAWAQNNGAGSFTIRQNIDVADGDFLQGVSVGHFTSDSFLQVLLSWHQSNRGIQMLTVPENPATTQWSWQRIHTTSQDEQLTAGDIDRDGDSDALLGTKWLRNNNLGTSWDMFDLFSQTEPDRNKLADIDRDGKLDAVVGYQGIGVPAKLAWYEQGSSATSAWSEHVISTTVIGPMSVDVADMDLDCDIDVIVGEHTNQGSQIANMKLWIFENLDGRGGSWQSHQVYQGDEHHDGAHAVDIDNDGDVDIASVGWINDKVVLYENLAK